MPPSQECQKGGLRGGARGDSYRNLLIGVKIEKLTANPNPRIGGLIVRRGLVVGYDTGQHFAVEITWEDWPWTMYTDLDPELLRGDDEPLLIRGHWKPVLPNQRVLPRRGEKGKFLGPCPRCLYESNAKRCPMCHPSDPSIVGLSKKSRHTHYPSNQHTLQLMVVMCLDSDYQALISCRGMVEMAGKKAGGMLTLILSLLVVYAAKRCLGSHLRYKPVSQPRTTAHPHGQSGRFRVRPKGTFKPVALLLGIAMLQHLTCRSVVGMDLNESDDESESRDDGSSTASVFRWHDMDKDFCKAYEMVKDYVRAGNHLHPHHTDLNNLFIGALANRLFSLDGTRREVAHPHAYVQAAFHTHINPTVWTIERYNPKPLQIIREVLHYLDLIDEHCERLLIDETEEGTETTALGAETNNQTVNTAQTVGAAGGLVMAACNQAQIH